MCPWSRGMCRVSSTPLILAVKDYNCSFSRDLKHPRHVDRVEHSPRASSLKKTKFLFLEKKKKTLRVLI
jgi:hypothetical protein